MPDNPFEVSVDQYGWVTSGNSVSDIISGIKDAISSISNFISNVEGVIPESIKWVLLTLLALVLGFISIKIMLAVMKAVFTF